MKFCCITPCLNAESHIEHTMRSVLDQLALGRPETELEYTIRDGGSRDRTLSVIGRVVEQYSGKKNIRIHVASEPDAGMYDALAKGFERSSVCDVYSYLNAGDRYAPDSFGIVAGIFQQHAVHFLTGINTILNEAGHVVDAFLPPRYKRSLLEQGCYGTLLPCVQQESTFWSGRLHAALDFEQLRAYRYAGDFFLWQSLAKLAPLDVVSAMLGGFCIHEGQLSAAHAQEYLAETRRTLTRMSPGVFMRSRAEKLRWYLPNRLKRKLNPGMFVFDPATNSYMPASLLFKS
jgi:glycosyltransferase involved in cell wall biosynthesis